MIADSNFGCYRNICLSCLQCFFLLFVNDPFILNRSGSLSFLLFLFRILFIVNMRRASEFKTNIQRVINKTGV